MNKTNKEKIMNENQNNIQYYDDEIDLRELVMALWKRKKMIIAFTLAVAILAASFSMFILSPVYKTSLDIIISMPEIYNTRYGEYKLPITTNEQYINLINSDDVLINTIKDMNYDTEEFSVENLNKRITVITPNTKTNTVQNSFTVTVSADNPEESHKLAKSLFEKIPIETANPNYIKIENDIIQNKQNINSIESSINKTMEYIDELNVEKQAVSKYYNNGRTEKLETSVIGIVENNVYLASQPAIPTQKSSPNNSLNTVIGAVLGGMIGVMAALFMEYWFKKENN